MSRDDIQVYNPRKSTVEKIPLIEKMYYSEGYSLSLISKQLKLDYSTVENVVQFILHGKRSRSDIARDSFNRLTQHQRLTFTESASKIRKTDRGYIDKLSKTKQGVKNPSSKLNEIKVGKIRSLYNELLQEGRRKTESQHLLAGMFNVKRSTISDIVLYRTWKHIDLSSIDSRSMKMPRDIKNN